MAQYELTTKQKQALHKEGHVNIVRNGKQVRVTPSMVKGQTTHAKIGDRRENRMVRRNAPRWYASLPTEERKRLATKAGSHLTPQEMKEYNKLTHPDYDPYEDDDQDVETITKRRGKLIKTLQEGMCEEYRRSKGYNPAYYNQPYGKRGKQTKSRR